MALGKAGGLPYLLTSEEKLAERKRKAAAQWNADAQFILGYLYGKVQGISKDYVLARMWANIAAASATGCEEQKKFINLCE